LAAEAGASVTVTEALGKLTESGFYRFLKLVCTAMNQLMKFGTIFKFSEFSFYCCKMKKVPGILQASRKVWLLQKPWGKAQFWPAF
jgi:hypothetical protein